MVGSTWICSQCFLIWAGTQLELVSGGLAKRFKFGLRLRGKNGIFIEHKLLKLLNSTNFKSVFYSKCGWGGMIKTEYLVSKRLFKFRINYLVDNTLDKNSFSGYVLKKWKMKNYFRPSIQFTKSLSLLVLRSWTCIIIV